MKIKFLHFEDNLNNLKTNIAYAPGYYWSEEFRDIVIKCEIVNYNVVLSVLQEGWLESYEISKINTDLKGGIGNAWEFIQFYKSPKLKIGGNTLFLIANINETPQEYKKYLLKALN